MLSHRDVADLEWYFADRVENNSAPSIEEGSVSLDLFGGVPSGLGAQLDRAALFHRDSADERIPPAGGAEVLCEDSDGQLSRRWSAWPYMYVKKEQPSASGASPGVSFASESAETDKEADRRRARDARRQRLSARLGQLDSADFTALRGLYGGRGLYWANWTEAGQRRHRVWVLLPLTPLGKRELERSGQDANTWLHELANPRSLKPAWLDAAVDQAERLERRACAAWTKTRPRRTPEDE